MGPVEKATARDLKKMPAEMAETAMAASALAMARELDSGSSSTSKSMCARVHLDIMNRLLELAPPVMEADGVDDLSATRARRLEGRAAAQD